MNVMLRYI
jgi:hypothetical protein